MIVIEFIVFVVSSGLFCSANFRHHLWAVIVAGVIATGSSLLFFYDFAERMLVHTEAPVKVVKQTVRVNVPVMQRVSQPPALSKPENCRDDYPFLSRIFGDEGTTELSFVVAADGAVSAIKVAKSSGSDRLDDAAKDCVAKWRYRPALKDNVLVDAPMTGKVNWNLDDEDAGKKAAAATEGRQRRRGQEIVQSSFPTFASSSRTSSGSMNANLSGMSRHTTRVFLSAARKRAFSLARCVFSITNTTSAHASISASTGVSASLLTPADATSMPSRPANTASAVGLRSRLRPQTKRMCFMRPAL